MRRPTREEQKRLVRLWDTTGPELERIRREALRGLPYNWEDVDALLSLADHYTGPPRTTSGLVEMQRFFMKAHPHTSTDPGPEESPDLQTPAEEPHAK